MTSTEKIIEHQNPGPPPSSASNRFGRVNRSFLSNTHAEGTHPSKESTGSRHLELVDNRSSSARKAQADDEAIVVNSVHSARREGPSPDNGVRTILNSQNLRLPRCKLT